MKNLYIAIYIYIVKKSILCVGLNVGDVSGSPGDSGRWGFGGVFGG